MLWIEDVRALKDALETLNARKSKMDSNSKSEETDRQNVGLNVPQRKKNTMSYKPHGPRNRNMTSEDFDQFLSVYEFFGFFVPFQEKKCSSFHQQLTDRVI